ncbi:MAG: NAD(P) transhydrogenase subunit alpha, partial [Bacteroidia bacterium]
MHSTKRFFAPLETNPAETRATVAPTTVSKLCALGLEVLIQSGAGTQSNYSDTEYEKAGATIVPDADTGYAQADIVARVSKPSPEDLDKIKPGTLHISFLDPFNEKELIDDLARRDISAISMEMIPRSTLAQKMDALSSQASLAGYAAVTMAT